MSEITASAIKLPLLQQPKKKKDNLISWLAPLTCLISGYLIWRFLIGSDSNLDKPDSIRGVWPDHEAPQTILSPISLTVIISPTPIPPHPTALTPAFQQLLVI